MQFAFYKISLKMIVVKIFILNLLLVLAATADEHDDDVSYITDMFGNTTQEFTFNILKSVNRVRKDQNFVISPFELRLAVMNLAEMTGGKTRAELLKALDNCKTFEHGRTTISTHLKSLKKTHKNILLEHTSNLDVSPSLPISGKATAVLKKFYDTALEVTDNLQPNEINLSNSIHFEGNWKHPFITSASNVMEVTAQFYFIDSKIFHSKIIRLPYAEKYAMFVFVPNNGFSVDTVFDHLTTANIQRETVYLDELKITLRMPKFVANHTENMTMHLKGNGVKRIFNSEEADLYGLIRSNDTIAISSVMQNRIHFVVDEGNVKYVEDAVGLRGAFIENLEVDLTKNSFVYYVEDETTGEWILAGKYLV